MRLEIELRCILFPLIILEMFLQLDWSPPVVKSIDWTWFGKAHSCLYKVPQLTMYVRAKTKLWDRKDCAKSSETGLCQGTDLGKVTKTCLQHWSSPRTRWPPSFLIGRSLEAPILLLELAFRPNWAIGGEGPWSERWPRTSCLQIISLLRNKVHEINNLLVTNYIHILTLKLT